MIGYQRLCPGCRSQDGAHDFGATCTLREEGWDGRIVIYTSTSGKKYEATASLPEKPWHEYTTLPTLKLEFRDERGKLVRKARVLPEDEWHSRGHWKLKEGQ